MMKYSLYINDYQTERTFSYLRWIFLIVAGVIFYYPPISNIMQFEHKTFDLLFSIGIIYMAAAHISLHKMDQAHPYFPHLIKSGIVFDYISLMWLMLLTGGVESVFFPITFLFVMHATIFWRTKGALVSSIMAAAGYIVILLQEAVLTDELLFTSVMNTVFIFVVGIFGAMIVLRERKQIKMNEIYHELIVTDYLTGLYNHRHFQERLRIYTEEKKKFILIMGDIDRFKQINDQYGHLVGDEVLRSLGKTFDGVMKEFSGQSFRYGGEEFAFILPFASEEELIPFFSKVFEALNGKFFTIEQWSITMSFGAAIFEENQTPDQLLAICDSLLYEAKSKGKNRACFKSGVCMLNQIMEEHVSVPS